MTDARFSHVMLNRYTTKSTRQNSMKIILFSILLITTLCIAQNNTFLPLEVENYWQFNVRHEGDNLDKTSHSYNSMDVLKDTLINNQEYFKVHMPGHFFILPLFLRYDSLSNTIKEFPTYYPADSALTFLDFNANLYDEFLWGGVSVRCVKVDSVEVFGHKKFVKGYILGTIPSFYIELAKDFGPIYIIHDESYVITSRYYFEIRYAIVNGQVFGQPTSIEKMINPYKFSLEQNFPNPFNPSTTIKYTLAKSEKVKIEVFNLLGQNLKTLVDQRMSAGAHSTDFISNELPTGVYLYKIEAGKYQDVKKMILLR